MPPKPNISASGARHRKYLERIKADPIRHEEYLLKQRENYKKRKESGERKSIKEKSEREQRITRKTWRIQKRESRQRLKKTVVLTPPSTPNPDDINDAPEPAAAAGPRRSRGRPRLRDIQKSAAYRKIQCLENKLEEKDRMIDRLRKTVARSKQSTLSFARLTPRSKTKALLKNTLNVPQRIRRTLDFHHSLLSDLKASLAEKSKRMGLMQSLSLNMTRKYRHMSTLQTQANARFNSGRVPRMRSRLAKRSFAIRLSVENFLKRDDNSRMTAGKKDVFKGNQKRLLLFSMKTLHEKYKSEPLAYSVSYSKFCKLRPPHIRAPTVQDREVCVYKLCDNIQFLIDKLHSLKILSANTLDALVPKMVCQQTNQDCMYRRCLSCRNKKLPTEMPPDARADQQTSWMQWRNSLVEYEKGGTTHHTKKVVKEKVGGPVRSLLESLQEALPKYLAHRYRVYHQYTVLRSLKDNLPENSALVHVDFSENYTCKYAKEITQHRMFRQPSMTELSTRQLALSPSVQSQALISMKHQGFGRILNQYSATFVK